MFIKVVEISMHINKIKDGIVIINTDNCDEYCASILGKAESFTEVVGYCVDDAIT